MVDGPLTQEEYLAAMAGGMLPPVPQPRGQAPARGLAGVLQNYGRQIEGSFQQPMIEQTMIAPENAAQIIEPAMTMTAALAASAADPMGFPRLETYPTSFAGPEGSFGAGVGGGGGGGGDAASAQTQSIIDDARNRLAQNVLRQKFDYDRGRATNATLGSVVNLGRDLAMGKGFADNVIAENAAARAAASPTPADIAQQQEDTLKRATGNEEAYASIMDRVTAGPDAGPLAYRANNPGAINAAEWVQNMPGYIGSYEGTPGNATAVFETPSLGFNVLAQRVAQNAGDGLSSYIASYGGGGQDYLTSGYYDSFLSASGLSPDATIDIGDDEQLFAILKGHTVAEGGAGRFSDEDILAGIAMFREEQAAEPAGDNDANAIVAATADNPPVMQLDYSTAKSASDIMDDLGLSKTPINAAEAFRRIQNTDYAGDFDAKEAALDSLFNAGIAMMRAASRPGASTLESLSYGIEALGAGIEGRRQQAEAAGEARRSQDVEMLMMQVADEQAAFDRRLAVVKQLNDAAAEARQATMDNATLQKTLAQTDEIRQRTNPAGITRMSDQDRRLAMQTALDYAQAMTPPLDTTLPPTQEQVEQHQNTLRYFYEEQLRALGVHPSDTLMLGTAAF
jgi:hypothetical protein